MTKKTIPVAGPSITQLEIDYAADAAGKCWYGNANEYHARFEKAFAEYIGVRHATALNSCTAGLHLSLAALGIGKGDEVIVPDITWIASAAPISYVDATPVFCDVDPDTWCLDVASAEACITEKTKAIIAVDLYGGVPDWDSLHAMAERHGVPIIEDAAEAIGTEYRERRAGGFGRTGVFSFHGSKTLTTGEGGMLVTDDSELFEGILFLRDHGRNPGDIMFENREVAFKYKMSSMQAAVGLAQLERVEELVAKKREIFEWYRRRLAGNSLLRLNHESDWVRNSYWMSSAIVSDEVELPKAKLINDLRENYGIDTRPIFSPLSSIPAYRNFETAKAARKGNPKAYQLSRQGVNLPSALVLDQGDVSCVCDALEEILERARDS